MPHAQPDAGATPGLPDDDAPAAPAVPSRTLALDPVEAGRLDLLLSGALAPERSVTLHVHLADAPAPGEAVTLLDLEGVRLGVLRVERVRPAGDHVLVTGEPSADARRPDRPDYHALRRSAADVRRELAARGWSPPVAALVEELPPTPDAMSAAVAAAGGRLLALALAPGAPDDPRHHARVRAWRRVVAPYGEAVLLALVPAGLPSDPAEAAALRGLLAGNYGADTVAANPAPDHAAVALPGSGGATVLFTGLSGSGKSTIAGRLLVHLMETGRTASLLDGDVVRTHLSKGLGFSRADRDANVRRIGFVAAEITKHGGIAICCPIAPYDETRRAVRAMVERHGRFVLVHVATPIEVCEARDRKGLYAKARAGEIPEFTGVSDPYEEPTDADLVVDTRVESADDAAARVVDHLRRLGVLSNDGQVDG